MSKDPIPNHIYEGDCLDVMRQWPDACVDHCIADPPFNMSKKKGLGWAFSSHVTMQETWDRFSKDEFFEFNVNWLREVCRVVKPNGNILVFGTYHNVYQLGFILRDVLDRRILNSIIWFKPNAQPNITARTLTESTEQIIWAVNNTPSKAKKWVFNYDEAKEVENGKQMRNFWDADRLNLWPVPVVPPSERRLGRHPAQKPLRLTDRLVMLATQRNALILDPFAGVAGVGISAIRQLRRYVLIEKSTHYARIAQNRLTAFMDDHEMARIRRLGGIAMTLNDVELAILRSVPVPQADRLDLVFDVASFVEEGQSTRAEIAERLRYVGRQGPYYADAAMALRLVGIRRATAEGAEEIYVTPIGKGYLQSSGVAREVTRRHIVLNAPIMKYVASALGATSNGSPVPYPVPEALLDETAVASILQEFELARNTAERRAATLCGWLSQL